MNNEIEEELGRKYIIYSLISKGSFGSVYRVKNKHNSRLSALKIINLQTCSKSTIIALMNEAKYLRNIKCDQVIRIYDELRIRDHYIYEVELLEVTLEEIITKGNLKNQEIRSIVKNILIGIEYLHSKRIIHRDLKPENIGFLHKNDYNTLKIFDFGLGIKTNKENIFFKQKVGTMMYMAPEIFYLNEYNYVFLTESGYLVHWNHSL